MQKHYDSLNNKIVRTGALQPTGGVSVLVTDADTGDVSTIYSDNGVTEAGNPLTTDENGYYEFFAANGKYNLSFTKDGITSRAVAAITLYDPDDAPPATLSTIAASGGSALVGHIASGTGAVARTDQSKLRDIVTDGDFDTAQHAATAALGKAFFVPASASVTVTVPTDAATLAAAMTAIARWVIPDSATVTIQLASGTTSNTTPITLSHPYGGRLQILGATPTTTTISAVGSITGSAGAWSLPYTVASGTGIAVGDYALIRNVAGTGAFEVFSGICKVTAVSGTTVTVTNTGRFAAWPTSTISSADLIVVKTILSFTGCDGIRIAGPIGRIDQLVLEGDRTSGTVGLITNRADVSKGAKAHAFCGNGASTTSFGISSFGDGCLYAQYGGAVSALYCYFANSLVYNVVGQHGGSVMANYAISSGSTEVGFAGSNSGDVSAENTISVGNGTYNYYAQSGGSVSIPSAVSKCAVSDGIRAAYGGAIRGQSATSSNNGGAGAFAVGGAIVVSSITASNNGNSGLYAEGGGNIYASGAALSSNTGYGAYADGAVVDMPSSTVSSNTVNGVTATNGGVILADQLGGTSNGTYLASASKAGVIRATSASTSGATVNADSGGSVDVTSATGTPVLNLGAGGRIIDTTGTLRWGQIATMRDSTYNSESTAGLILKNFTDPLKWVVAGYDNTRDYGYIQALKSTSGYKNLALNPNGGNVGIGLGSTAPASTFDVSGSIGFGAPVTKTADFTVAVTDHWLINNKSGSSCTVTLPSAASFTRRQIKITNYQAQTVVSASSNVVPITGGAAGTAILAATAGKWATMVSDGTNWVVTEAN